MRLINSDKLQPDCLTKDGKFAISQSQIANAPTITPEKALTNKLKERVKNELNDELNELNTEEQEKLIDADELKRLFRNVNESMFQLSRVYELIDNAPTVEAYPFEQVQELVKLNQQFAQEIENLKRPQDGESTDNCYSV